MNKAILCALTLAVGMSLGAVIDQHLLSSPPSAATGDVIADGSTPSAPLTEVSGTGTNPIDMAPMRAMIREELALAMAKLQDGTASTRVAAVVQAAGSVASASQQREALQAADMVLSGGKWGNEERATFHQKLALLDPQQREQEMQRLVQAIRSGSLKVSGNGRML